MAWARKHGVAELDVTASSAEQAATWARRATCFASPPTVRFGGRLAVPAPPPVQPPVDGSLAPLIVEAGAEPVVEHGVLYGEVLGLEVCRVVDGVLEVGVGKHDREAHRMIHGDRPVLDALRRAVDIVRTQRPYHLAAARWLRSVVVRRPELVGLAVGGLAPVAPPLPRVDLRAPSAAPAVGDGVVVVCSVGVDLDLVPTAADARLMHAPDTRLVLVVPERDAHPVTRALAAALVEPAEVVTVPNDWRAL